MLRLWVLRACTGGPAPKPLLMLEPIWKVRLQLRLGGTEGTVSMKPDVNREQGVALGTGLSRVMTLFISP